MGAVKLSGSFEYKGAECAKGVLFKGGLYADERGVYIVHDSYRRESLWMTQLGLVGLLIQYFRTSKEPAPCPFPAVEVSKLDPAVFHALDLRSFKPTAVVSAIPIEQVDGYKKSLVTGNRVVVNGVEIVIRDILARGIDQLEKLGYRDLSKTRA